MSDFESMTPVAREQYGFSTEVRTYPQIGGRQVVLITVNDHSMEALKDAHQAMDGLVDTEFQVVLIEGHNGEHDAVKTKVGSAVSMHHAIKDRSIIQNPFVFPTALRVFEQFQMKLQEENPRIPFEHVAARFFLATRAYADFRGRHPSEALVRMLHRTLGVAYPDFDIRTAVGQVQQGDRFLQNHQVIRRNVMDYERVVNASNILSVEPLKQAIQNTPEGKLLIFCDVERQGAVEEALRQLKEATV